MALFLSIGEAMVELSQTESGLWEQRFAGDTLNTAWYARRYLGQDWTVSYFTCIGEDSFSKRFLKFLAKEQIDTRFIRQSPARNIGLYAIELTEGERSFAYWRATSAARGLADDETLLQAAIEAADVVYLSGITLAILPPEKRGVLLALVRAARAKGKLTAFDPNIRPALWESQDALRSVLTQAAACATIALPSYDDEARVFGDPTPEACAKRWCAAGADEVVVKNGGAPFLVKSADAEVTLSPPAQRPVDSTGAGDAFNGGYLAARLSGCPPSEAAAKAHDIAVQVIAQRGALVRTQ
jgi:2-dehydro-3-deoxygluconokinase